MKIRSGFVSNSSSSSFILQQDYDYEYVSKLVETLREQFNSLYKENFTQEDYMIFPVTKEYIEKLKNLNVLRFVRSCTKGRLVISSTCDNSIPYQFIDILKCHLNCDVLEHI